MEADGLHTEGKREAALKKYQQAQKDLLELKRLNPGWNQKIVAFRLNELSEKIASFTSPEPPAADSSSNASLNGDGIRLLSAGAEPRRLLRYKPEPGLTQVSILTIKTTGGVEVPGMPERPKTSNTLKMTVETIVTGVQENGDIAFDAVMKDVDLTADGMSEAQADKMKEVILAVKGTKVSGVVSSRGAPRKESEQSVSEASKSNERSEKLKTFLLDPTTEWPEEPVGVGARWEKRRVQTEDGFKIMETTVWEIVSIEGDSVVLSGKGSQTAKSGQRINNPQMPNVKVELAKVSGTGTETATLDLTRLVPVSGAALQDAEYVVTMSAGARTQNLATRQHVEISVRTE